MSKRQPGRNQTRTNSHTTKNTLSASSARQNLQQGTKVLESLKTLASHCISRSNFSEAKPLLERAIKMNPEDPDLLVMLAKVLINTGDYSRAVETLSLIFDKDLNIPGAHFLASYALYHLHDFELALKHVSKALMLNPYESEYLFHKATTLMSLSRYTDAVPLFERLLAQSPDNFIYLNNAGNLYRDLGQLDKALDYFKQAMKLTQDNSYPYSNYLTTLHYDPEQSQEAIYSVCREWEQSFAPEQIPPRPVPEDKRAEKRLRIGMISDGFRNHPVGQMIIAPFEKLPEHAFQFVCYSSNSQADQITRRFQKISTYKTVSHLSDEALAQLIREDEVDILFDLAGHNSGTRMKVMAMQPAPLLVKWVGGLINTTGLSTIDYLLTDFVESPEGDDHFYTEKLIRMPGDYICYEAPPYTPAINTLPAQSNGYITLGCFNNPMKLNPVVLEQWAQIMRELPDSRLYLKGHQYTAEDLRQRVLDTLAQHDIAPSRVTLEGPSKHNELLACYNQIDIALDPWPYSGGLTTCEAFLMGVPVVTMPGPTFAGRHSASHLVNAGMPELVTHSWEEYRNRVIELASDLDSLSTIRSHLRSILLQSPVCNAEAFSGHFGNAMRAIWQRYCEGKQPETLNCTASGEAVFADQTEPMQLQFPMDAAKENKMATFKWEFEGKVIAVDHGGQLMNVPMIQQMLDLGTLELIVFDPASNHLKHPLRQHKSVHCYPNTALGNGQPATLYACQAAEQSGTLKPAPQAHIHEQLKQNLQVLAELPIGTAALDRVSELPSLDWLVLDERNDAMAILENGEASLKNTLLIQARIAFQSTHEHQPNFAEVSHWASRHGFCFYSLINSSHQGRSGINQLDRLSGTHELFSADAIFIPDHTRMVALSSNQAMKLAFILSSVYDAHDLSFSILDKGSSELAEAFIVSKGISEHKKELPYFSIHNDYHRELVVGVPIYNEEPYIQETIESLLKQDIDNVRFHISDNASTDRTAEIIQDLTGSDPRFHLHSHESNIGALNNFEYTFKESSSDFFMWLGGHDYISENLLNNALRALKGDPSISMVCGSPMAVMDGTVLGHVTEATYQFDEDSSFHRYSKSIAALANCTIFHSLFCRKHLNDYEFRHTISNDHVLISRLLAFGKLHYLKSDAYFRRYFSGRESTQEERMLGESKEMGRQDFYDHYIDDFNKVFKDQPDVLRHADQLKSILLKRFGK